MIYEEILKRPERQLNLSKSFIVTQRSEKTFTMSIFFAHDEGSLKFYCRILVYLEIFKDILSLFVVEKQIYKGSLRTHFNIRDALSNLV